MSVGLLSFGGVGGFCCLCGLRGLLFCDVNSVVHVISFELVWINLLGLLGLMVVCCCFIYWLLGLGFGYRCGVGDGCLVCLF